MWFRARDLAGWSLPPRANGKVPSSQSQRKGVRARALEQAVAAMARGRVASESVRVKAARDHLAQAGVTLD